VTRRWNWIAGLAAGALSMAPVAAQAPSPEPAVPFKVGEVLTYDVSWSTFLTAGTATMTVKERRAAGGSGAVYDLVAEGRPGSLLDRMYHVYYKAETLLNTRTLQPSIATVYSDERGRTKLRTVRFTGRTTLEYEPKANVPGEKHTMPALSQDPLAAVYVMRVLPLKTGQVLTMPIVDGPDVFNARWVVAGPEPIATTVGATQAWRLTPTLSDAQGKPVPARRMTMWLSNDARRLPLKLEVALSAGSFILTLTRVAG
jgi:hypothetical protein